MRCGGGGCHQQHPVEQLVAIPVFREVLQVIHRVARNCDRHTHILPPRPSTSPLGIRHVAEEEASRRYPIFTSGSPVARPVASAVHPQWFATAFSSSWQSDCSPPASSPIP